MKQVKLILASLLLLALLPACGPSRLGYKPPTDVDVAERAPVGQKFDVESFKWRYLNGGRLEVTGTIKNNTGKAQSGLTIFAMMFDETGKAVAMGESFLSPTYVEAGKTAQFKIVAQTDRPKGIEHLRLLTNTIKE